MGKQDITTLNTLIATTIDSANGFEEAARTASASGLSMQFAELARDRWQLVEKLEDEVRRMGGEPKRSGTAKAAAHRRWLDIRNAVAGSDRAVLQEVENGETYLCSKYETALGTTDMSTEARRCIEDAFASIRRDQERVRGLSMTVGSSQQAGRLNTDWRRLGSTIGMAAAFGTAAFVATRMMRSRREPSTGQRWRRGRTLTIDRTDRAEIEARNAEAVPTSASDATAAAGQMSSSSTSNSGSRSTKRASGRRSTQSGDSGTAGMTAGGSMGAGMSASGSSGMGMGGGMGSSTGSSTASRSTDSGGTGFQSSGGAADLSTGGGTGMSSGGSDDTSSGAGNTGSFGSTGGSGSFGR